MVSRSSASSFWYVVGVIWPVVSSTLASSKAARAPLASCILLGEWSGSRAGTAAASGVGERRSYCRCLGMRFESLI